MAQCLGLAFATERIPFATAIAPIYAQTAEEFAQMTAYLHEVSGRRFQFGIGVAHPPSHARMGVTPFSTTMFLRPIRSPTARRSISPSVSNCLQLGAAALQ